MSEWKKRKKWMIILDCFLLIVFPFIPYKHYLENGFELSTYIIIIGLSFAWFSQFNRLYKDKKLADANKASNK